MAIFSMALEYVLKNEGGLSDDPKDRGGITNFGISLRFLKTMDHPEKYGITGGIDAQTIRDLTVGQAHDIYKGEFWDAAPFGSVNDQDVCNFMFDMGVNLGIAPAIKCTQRAIWSVWAHYLATQDDGVLGPDTLMWIERCKPDRLLPAMRSERAGTYRVIMKANPSQLVFSENWLSRAYGHSR